MTTMRLITLMGALSLLTSAHVGPMNAKSARFPVPKKQANRNDGNAEEYFFDTKLDHFDAEGKSSSFSMRYLIDRTYWDPETGPILFYAGNEGDIYSFYDNTGFMTETIA